MPPGRKAARCAVYLSAAPGRSRRRIGAIKERAAAFTMMRVGPCRCVPDALPRGAAASLQAGDPQSSLQGLTYNDME